MVARYADAPVPVTVAPFDAGGPTGADGTTSPGPGADLVDCDKIDPASWPVTGNRDRLDRMLVNLIDNAMRYAKSSVAVSVSQIGLVGRAGRDRRRPGHTTSPTGSGPSTGSPASTTPVPAAADDAGGAGLGLAIVRATAQSHGGTAHLEASPCSESGLRAVVRLPAVVALVSALTTSAGGCHRQDADP